MADRVTYIDGNGEKKTGVLAEYQAAAREQSAAPVQSTVQPAAVAQQTEEQTAAVGGAVPAQSTEQPTTQQQYQNAAAVLAAQQQHNAEAAERARQRTAESIQYQMSNNNAQIDRQNQQAYLDYVRNQRVMPEQLNALGITGGLAESSLVKLGAGYGSLVNENELARRQAMSALYEQQAQQDYQTGETQRAADLAARQQYYAQQQKGQENAAQLAAQIGDFSGYVTLGLMTPEQAELQKKAWIKQNGKLAQALGYVKSSTKKTNTGTKVPDTDPLAGLSDGAKLIVSQASFSEERNGAGGGAKYLEGVQQQINAGKSNKTQADYNAAVKAMSSMGKQRG